MTYMEPVFKQKWHLFAPEPRMSEFRIFNRCKTNEVWSEWIDPAQNVLETHRFMRAFYHGKMAFALAPSTKVLIVDYSIDSSDQHRINYHAPEMEDIISLSYWLCRQKHAKSTSAQFRLEYTTIKNYLLRQDDSVLNPKLIFDFPESEIKNEY